MSQIDREGIFRGYIVESGVGRAKSSKAHQFMARLRATEMYNEDTQEWMEWDFDENEITGYFFFCNKDKKLIDFQVENLARALGWSGDIVELGTTDYSDTLVQFHVKEDTYDGKTNLKVMRIDHADANPARTLQKLDSKELKALSAELSRKAVTLLGGPKPKPVGKPTVKKETKTEEPAKKAAKKAAKKTSKPPRPGKSEEKTELPPLPEKAEDDNVAWDQVLEYVAENVTDSTLTEVWEQAVEEMGGADAIDEADNWAGVRDSVLKTVGTK